MFSCRCVIPCVLSESWTLCLFLSHVRVSSPCSLATFPSYFHVASVSLVCPRVLCPVMSLFSPPISASMSPCLFLPWFRCLFPFCLFYFDSITSRVWFVFLVRHYVYCSCVSRVFHFPRQPLVYFWCEFSFVRWQVIFSPCAMFLFSQVSGIHVHVSHIQVSCSLCLVLVFPSLVYC